MVTSEVHNRLDKKFADLGFKSAAVPPSTPTFHDPFLQDQYEKMQEAIDNREVMFYDLVTINHCIYSTIQNSVTDSDLEDAANLMIILEEAKQGYVIESYRDEEYAKKEIRRFLTPDAVRRNKAVRVLPDENTFQEDYGVTYQEMLDQIEDRRLWNGKLTKAILASAFVSGLVFDFQFHSTERMIAAGILYAGTIGAFLLYRESRKVPDKQSLDMAIKASKQMAWVKHCDNI